MQNKKYDAILIPGGGLRNQDDLPPYVQRRLDRVIEIHQGEPIITLSAGTIHKPPPRDNNGFPIFESVAAAGYLIKKGIDPRQVLCETCSYDTIGNAYFSRVIHVEPRAFKKLLVITSAFHLPRTRAIFQWVYDLKTPSMPGGYDINFEEVPDEGIDEDSLLARVKKEKTSLRNVLRLKKEIRTFQDFHKWLFTEHGAYSVAPQPERVSGNILETY